MNMAKKLAAGLLVLLMLMSVPAVCFAEDDLFPEPEFDNEPLPASFDLFEEERMTPAKSQGGTGLCWAFGTLSSVESAILTAGLAEPDGLDLSECTVAYFMYPLPEEFANGGTGDGLCITQGNLRTNFYMACFYGGDPRLAFSMFANGEALTDESVSPLFTDSIRLSGSLDRFLEVVSAGKIGRSSDDWLLTGWNSFDEAGTEEMKRAIRKYGGLIAGIFCDTGGIRKHRDTGAPTSYYSAADSVETNHCVVLIGWDDDYSRDNFGKYKPEHDGAWLALDSTDALSNDSGLIYISYDDLIQGYWTVGMCARSDYGDILHYDYCPLDSLRDDGSSTVAANVFTAPSGKALTAVGVTTLADSQLIEIKVLIDPDGGPDGGRAAVTQKARPARKGYHVIELDEPAALREGDTFSIVVTYYADPDGGEQSGCVPVESEHFPDFELSPSLKYKAEFRIAVHPGESFVMHGGRWHDLADEATAALFGKEYPIGNVGIKALLEA